MSDSRRNGSTGGSRSLHRVRHFDELEGILREREEKGLPPLELVRVEWRGKTLIEAEPETAGSPSSLASPPSASRK